MKNSLIAIATVLALSGCAVGRHGQLYVNPVAAGVIAGAAVVLVYEQNVTYPYREQEYFYDRGYGGYFFFDNRSQRHYMPRGWGYHTHGVPGYRH